MRPRTPPFAAPVALAAAIAAAAAPSRAAERVAIVDEVSAPGLRVAALDYLERGRVLALAPGERIAIAYLSTCVTETVTGGRVTIGDGRSAVEGGAVERGRVSCDGGRLRLPAASASSGGAMIFRDPPAGGLPAPRLRVFGVSPILDLGPRVARVAIERLDAPAPALAARLGEATALRRGVHDLGRAGVRLEPGGLYHLVAGGRELVIAVAATAEPAPRSALSRFVPFRDLAGAVPKPAG